MTPRITSPDALAREPHDTLPDDVRETIDATLNRLAGATAAVIATHYPRPQLVRPGWTSLDGVWDFAFDDDDRGLHEHWERGGLFDRTIRVPFPPESPASGIAETGPHTVSWYRRTVTDAELRQSGEHERYLLHFGAADYQTTVWVDGQLVGGHRGGQSPFSFDITDVLDADVTSHQVVVRCFDDPTDVEMARGKQDWRVQPHSIWYERTSGIWQTVWLEAVPAVHIQQVTWESDLPAATVTASVRLSRRPARPVRVRVELRSGAERLATCMVESESELVEVLVGVPALRNGQEYEHLTWSPETPTLLDATVTVEDGGSVDRVESYLGLRSVAVEHRNLLLNDRPYVLRSVLSQGYWPESHLAAPSPEALRHEVELIKALGFNAVRVHQKAEDPRFLFWCDYLGLAVWAESASAYQYSPRSAALYTNEWMELVERDRSHPSIITWVPLNESWGVQHIAHRAAQQAFSRSIADLTRALDPSRPVISNDGWEHASSDIVTVHDYTDSPEVITARYDRPDGLAQLLDGMGPAGRKMRVCEPGWRSDAPVMLTEFGGIAFAAPVDSDAWGYSNAADAEDFADRLGGLVGAARESRELAGFCYTQLTDTRQEANGLCDEYRRPKLPVGTIRQIVTGETEDADVDAPSQAALELAR